ncbi:MAG: GntR family transcriptional regulator [Planctomycetota bacterium]
MAPRGRTPVHGRVTEHVRTLIRRQALRPGDPLPSERALAEQLGLSHVTVRRGLAALVEAGMVERVVGRGTFVARQTPPAEAAQPLADSESASAPPRTVVLAMSRILMHLSSVGYALAGMRQVFPQDDVCLEVLGYDPHRFAELEKHQLRRRPVAGLLVQGWLDPEEAALLEERGLPFVLSHSATAQGRGYPAVSVDYHDLLDQAVHEAYRFGHRQLAFVRWTHDIPQPSALDDYGVICRQRNLYDAARRVVYLSQQPPAHRGRVPYPVNPAELDLSPHHAQLDAATCLIANDEIVAAALMRDLAARGRSVPEEVSLVSLHDFTPHAHRVPLSAPDSPTELTRIYRQAAQMLQARIAGRPLAQPQDRLHRCRIQFKASLGPAPRRGKEADRLATS